MDEGHLCRHPAPWEREVSEDWKPRKLAAPGLGSQLSEVDTVVFGVDMDGSDQVEKSVRKARDFSGAAGGTSRELGAILQVEAPHKRHFSGYASASHSEVDELVFGVDMDGSTRAQHLAEHPKACVVSSKTAAGV